VADDDGTSGKVVQTGSTNNCNNGAWFRLGVGYDAYGYYILSNGVMNVLGGLLNVGEYGTGYLEVDNGVFNGSGNFNFGVNQITAVGTLVVNGGVVNSAGEMHFGVAGTGHLILHGGSLNVSNALVIGRGDGTGQGDLYMDGGVINKNSTGFVALGMGGGGCTGVITQDGGIFNSAAPIYLGWNGAGTWNLNGGTAALGEVWLGIGASGVFNLNGGNLTASWIHGNNGVFNFNGGTLRAGAASPTWLNGLSAAYVNSGGAIIDTAGYDVSIGQPLLAGGGGLTKLGSGTLLLNAANTYTGATTNAAGILGGAGSLSGPVINQAIATLAPGAGANLPVTFTVNADVTLNAGGFTAMKLYKGGSPVSDQVVCSGTVNYGGELLITSLGTALAQGDTFQLFNAGGQSGNFTAIVGNAGTGNDFSFNPASGVLTIVAAPINTWNNASADSLWNGTSANWTLPTVWIDGNDAIFDVTGIGGITLSTSVAARNLTFNSAGYSIGANAGNVLTLSGATPTITVNANGANIPLNVPIAGTQGLTVNGTPTSALTLGSSNTFSGGTLVKSGTLVLNGTSVNGSSIYAVDSIEALDAEATVKFFNGISGTNNLRTPNGQIARGYGKRMQLTGGTFDLAGDDGQNQVPVPEGTGTIINSSEYAQATLKMVGGDGTHTFSGIIADGGPVTNSIVPGKFAHRTDIDCQDFQLNCVFVLAGANTYSGSTRRGSGVLKLSGVGTLGVTTTNTPAIGLRINVTSGSTALGVDLNGTSQRVSGLGGNGGILGNSAIGTTSVLTLGVIDGARDGAAVSWPGQLVDNAGSGGILAITKVGTNTQAFAGTSTYSGDTTVNNGVLAFTAVGAVSPTSAFRLSSSQGTLALNYVGTANVKQLYINGVSMPNGVYGSSTAPITGTGFVQVTGSMMNTWNNASADSLWNGTSANWTLPTTWIDGNDAIFGATGIGAITLSTSVSTHNLTFNSAGYTIGANAGNVLTLNGTTPTITVNAAGANIPLNVPIAGTQGLTVNGTPTSALTLASSNSYSGGTFVKGGTLVLNGTSVNGSSIYAVDSIEALDAGATVKFFNGIDGTNNLRAPNGQIVRGYGKRMLLTGGTFDLAGDNGQNQVPVPEGTGMIINSSEYAQATLKMVGGDGTHTFSGIIADGGPVTNSIIPGRVAHRTDIDCQDFQLNCVFVLAGANTYSGSTRRGSGVLKLSGVGTLGVVTTNTPAISLRINSTAGSDALGVDLNGTSQRIAGMGGNGGVIGNSAIGTTSVLTMGVIDGALDGSAVSWPGKLVDNYGGGGILALTKVGTNTQAFSGTSTYSGDTTVINGVLAFTAAAAVSTNSAFRLFTSQGTLALNYVGTVTAKQLDINGVAQPNGVYGSSTAPITGTGFLQIQGSTAQPILNSSNSGGNLTFSWPGGVGNFKLQSQTNSLTGAWYDYPGGISNPVTVPISMTETAVFFRLAATP
jgi:fibronectin-binding autotransporter adhesin